MPSIPDYRRGKPNKDLGPGSYSPNDQLTSYNRGVTRIHKPEANLPDAAAPERESYLRRKVLKIINPVEHEEETTSFGMNGSKNILDGLLRNSSSTQNIGPSESPTQDKARVLVRKVSKVSILSTARKVENNKIMTEQRLIPLQQQTLQKIEDKKDQKHVSP